MYSLHILSDWFNPIKTKWWLGGLLFKPGGSNLQHTTALSFLLIVYARYMQSAKKTVTCGNEVVDPARLINLAKSQVCMQLHCSRAIDHK